MSCRSLFSCWLMVEDFTPCPLSSCNSGDSLYTPFSIFLPSLPSTFSLVSKRIESGNTDYKGDNGSSLNLGFQLNSQFQGSTLQTIHLSELGREGDSRTGSTIWTGFKNLAFTSKKNSDLIPQLLI